MSHRMCAECGKPAVYDRKGRRGKMKARTDHDLCPRHWRAVMDAARAAKEVMDDSKQGKQW